MKHWKSALAALLLAAALTGCNVKHAALMDVTNTADTALESRFLLKSGTYIQWLELPEEPSLQFDCVLEKGSIRFRIEDGEGTEQYDRTFTETGGDTAVLEEPGRYRLTVECEGASGSYSVLWGKEAQDP